MEALEKVKKKLIEQALPAVLIHSKENKRYFGALEGSGVWLLITLEEQYQIVDGRYTTEAEKNNTIFKVKTVQKGEYIKECIQLLEQLKINELAIETSDLPISEYLLLSQSSLHLTFWDSILTELRSIKTPMEIQRIGEACALTDDIFQELLPYIYPGVTECELNARIHRLSLAKGASKMAFDPIIASGIRGAFPHGRPTMKKLKQGELVTIDFGIVWKGYQSDMTRTVALGKTDKLLEEIYQVVLTAQLAGIAMIKAGAIANEVDLAARKVIDQAGYGDYFSHGLGHGIGIGGDAPILNQTSNTQLKENMVMSCEPGIYIPEVGGVRIEDDVVIQSGIGCSLNKTSKILLRVGE